MTSNISKNIAALNQHQDNMPQHSTQDSQPAMDECKENIEALKKLFESRNPPVQTVQQLLDITWDKRKEWLQSPTLSIQDIIKEYPVFGHSKWVS